MIAANCEDLARDSQHRQKVDEICVENRAQFQLIESNLNDISSGNVSINL